MTSADPQIVEVQPPIRLHDLRHGAASLALSAGTDLKIVQDMLGHPSIVLTADTYTSVLPDLARKAAEDRPRRAAAVTSRTMSHHAQRAARPYHGQPPAMPAAACRRGKRGTTRSGRVRRQGLEPRARGLRAAFTILRGIKLYQRIPCAASSCTSTRFVVPGCAGCCRVVPGQTSKHRANMTGGACRVQK